MAGPKVKKVLIYPVKQRFSITRARAAGNGNMAGIPVPIVTGSLVIAGCTVCNGMGYVLPGATQFEAVAIPVAAISVIGSRTIGDSNGGWLSVQVPAII